MKTVIRLLVVLGVAVAITAGYIAMQRSTAPEPLTLGFGSALSSPQPVADFTLSDYSGKPFTREQLTGHWSLLFIGFTHCPDVCPQTLAILDAVHGRLPADSADIRTIFVSVDPERDSPENLAEYTGFFNSEFAGVTGAQSELERLTESIGFAWVKVPGSGGRYTVDHSTPVALIDPEARVVGYFSQPLEIDAMVADLAGLH